AEQAFINYPTVTAPPPGNLAGGEGAGRDNNVRQRYQIAGGVLVPAANNNTVATGNVTVISGGEATLDRIASGGGALTLPTSRPIAMVCPVCKCTVVTRVHYRSGACTLFAAAGLCCTFPLFFWIPFCCSDLKDVIHV
ncbi:hypothetical protein FOZ63_032119, partial [Perkinsus olseni]